MSNVPILEVQSVVKTYPSKHHDVVALDHVDLSISIGDAVGLVGESGSGKTTLTRLLLGLERPDSGSIAFRGTPLDKLDKLGWRDFRSSVSAVFQNPYSSLNPRTRVWSIVTEQSAIARTATRSQRRTRARELLDTVGLPPDVDERFPHQLSGGQRQRVAIARAIAEQPEVIVLDEPVSALDVSVSAQIVNLLLDIQDDLGVAYLFVAHDMELVHHLCHRVTVLYHGRVVEAGETSAVLGSPTDAYTRGLMEASRLESLDGAPDPQPVHDGLHPSQPTEIVP